MQSMEDACTFRYITPHTPSILDLLFSTFTSLFTHFYVFQANSASQSTIFVSNRSLLQEGHYEALKQPLVFEYSCGKAVYGVLLQQMHGVHITVTHCVLGCHLHTCLAPACDASNVVLSPSLLSTTCTYTLTSVRYDNPETLWTNVTISRRDATGAEQIS